MRRSTRTVLVLGAVAVVVAGVVTLASGRPYQWWFALRDPLPSCGTVEHGPQGGGVPDAARECLDDAWDTGAELTVMTPTTEGDPTFTYYRVGGGGLEIFRDTTADAYGAGTWQRRTCAGADLEDALAHC